ncbi:hypothetical protein [Terriglobus saanensis]|uniref:hypothetical protein n=1 Tax=Terriglobus saanensis TaxID=870903 RepID=UPI0002FB3CCE|nr:hypothetical protein [Terriglobus saanensis]
MKLGGGAGKKQISPLRDGEAVAPVEMTETSPTPHTVISTERVAGAEKSAFVMRRRRIQSRSAT